MSNLSPSRAQKAVSTVKVLYFLVFAGIGIFTSFINIYYRSINLSGTQIGLINMVSPLVGIFSSIAGGMLSDRFGKNRRIFIIACLGIIISIIGLRYV
jgi:PPP family 3-phenylpropionic acid transporter